MCAPGHARFCLGGGRSGPPRCTHLSCSLSLQPRAHSSAGYIYLRFAPQTASCLLPAVVGRLHAYSPRAPPHSSSSTASMRKIYKRTSKIVCADFQPRTLWDTVFYTLPTLKMLNFVTEFGGLKTKPSQNTRACDSHAACGACART